MVELIMALWESQAEVGNKSRVRLMIDESVLVFDISECYLIQYYFD